jgi:lysophospholipase L1-like esterase
MRKLLIFGDSIVFGRNVERGSNWVAQLDSFFKKKFVDETLVYNLGIPGERSGGVLTRIGTEILARTKQKDPDDFIIIVIATGLNDAKIVNGEARTPIAEFENNIQEIVEIATDYADLILLVGPIKIDHNTPSDFRNSSTDAYNRVLSSVAKAKAVAFVDLFSSWPKDARQLYSFDGVHPNAQGHAFICDKISRALTASQSRFLFHR